MVLGPMQRRDFIVLLGGAAAAWPLAARAQQPAVPIVGILNGGAPGEYARFVAAFGQSLSDAGYVEGRNLAIDYRSAEGRYDRLPALAAELARKEVAVILAIGGGPRRSQPSQRPPRSRSFLRTAAIQSDSVLLQA
jgi:putative ABC transport system substrate-binding protein